MLKTMQKYSITLAVFAATSAGIITLVNLLTQNTISKKASLQLKMMLDLVIPVELYNNNIQKSCLIVSSPQLGKGIHRVYIARKDNTLVGVVMEVTMPGGHFGDILLLVATDFNGKVLGARVTKYYETPGLVDKINLDLSNWIVGFSGKIIQDTKDTTIAIKKDGEEFDLFTGVTIASRAVVNAVKLACQYAEKLPAQLNTLSPCKSNRR